MQRNGAGLALADVAVVLDSEVAEMALVGSANSIDDELIPGNVVEPFHLAAVVQRDVLLFVEIDGELHHVAEADRGGSFAPAIGHEERNDLRGVAAAVSER